MIVFQGEIGAFSEQAAQNYFGADAHIQPLPTFEATFQSVTDGQATFAVIPIENSLFGSVHINYDLLQSHDLVIIGELKLRIVHNLMALKGESLASIQKVYSHPQALGQSKAFLDTTLGHAEVIPAYDTAGSAKMISENNLKGCAAIAGKSAAAHYGLEILAEGVETNHQNYTRFLVLCKPENAPLAPALEQPKTSLVFALKENVPGALFKSLACFSLREIDILKIESRPLVGSPFAYLFYMDIAGNLIDEHVKKAITHLEELSAFQKVLGSYNNGAFYSN